jgi:hypothetical protein
MATLSPNALEAYCWPELPVDYIRERDEPASPTGIQRIIAALSHHGELKRPAYQRAFIGRLDALTDSGAFNEGFNGEAARAAYEFFSQELAMAKARVAPPAPAARELDAQAEFFHATYNAPALRQGAHREDILVSYVARFKGAFGCLTDRVPRRFIKWLMRESYDLEEFFSTAAAYWAANPGHYSSSETEEFLRSFWSVRLRKPLPTGECVLPTRQIAQLRKAA